MKNKSYKEYKIGDKFTISKASGYHQYQGYTRTKELRIFTVRIILSDGNFSGIAQDTYTNSYWASEVDEYNPVKHPRRRLRGMGL